MKYLVDARFREEMLHVWKTKQETFVKEYTLNDWSEKEVETFPTIEDLVASVDWSPWILQGVQSIELQEAIEKHFEI